ncbi:hypothetical protein [Flavobacterium sp. '19STA2R22 D10 B1']|uniref:hypothetical protein n=1 Tax=Flavobacterium aerium TaxID=3037261 RepID=UPI00278C8F55|nr:hypothetical protein [Flavobacterium sp. '19STA2R22 D10 B1']
MILISNVLLAQSKDTIEFKVDMKMNYDRAKKNALERYEYTVEKYDSVAAQFSKKDVIFVLSKYKFEQFELTTIPVFELDRTSRINKKVNILQYLKNRINDEHVFYRLYIDGKVVMDDFLVTRDYSRIDLINYALLGFDFNDPNNAVSSMDYLTKLGLERNKFVFHIKGFLSLFIVEKGIVYAITNATEDGEYDLTEINEYMGCEVGKRNLNIILKSECLFCSLRKGVKRRDYFKGSYYFKVEKE